LRRNLRGELAEAFPKYPVEGWEWMDDVGERPQRSAEFDRQHELAHDLAREWLQQSIAVRSTLAI
jgi:hypothetical protein